MKKQLLVIFAILTTACAATPARAESFTVSVGAPSPVFVGRWYGRHEGRIGWWQVSRGHWHRWERPVHYVYRRY